MKIIILAVLLTSCATKGKILDKPEVVPVVENTIDVKEELKKLDYYIKHDKCFINYAICLGEKKKQCWAKHEACVIAVYQEWMKFQ